MAYDISIKQTINEYSAELKHNAWNYLMNEDIHYLS